MNVIPVKDKALVKLLHETDMTESGIITSTKPKGLFSNYATVMAVGPECKELKPGMNVLTPRSCGTDVTIEGDHYVMLLEAEVLGVFEGDLPKNVMQPKDLPQVNA